MSSPNYYYNCGIIFINLHMSYYTASLITAAGGGKQYVLSYAETTLGQCMPPSPCMQVVSQLTALLPWENWSRYKQGCGHGKDMRPGVSVHRFWLQLLATVAPSRVSSSGHCFQYPTWKTHNHFDIVSSLSPLYYSDGRDGSTHTLWLLWQMTLVTRWSRIMCSYLSQDHVPGTGAVSALNMSECGCGHCMVTGGYTYTQQHQYICTVTESEYEYLLAWYFHFLGSAPSWLLNIMRCKCNNLSLMKIYPIKYGDEYVKYLCYTFG